MAPMMPEGPLQYWHDPKSQGRMIPVHMDRHTLFMDLASDLHSQGYTPEEIAEAFKKILEP